MLTLYNAGQLGREYSRLTIDRSGATPRMLGFTASNEDEGATVAVVRDQFLTLVRQGCAYFGVAVTLGDVTDPAPMVEGSIE